MKTFSFHTRSFVFCLCFLLAGCFAGLAYGQQTQGKGGRQTGIGQPNAAQQPMLGAIADICAEQQAVDAAQAELSVLMQEMDSLTKELQAAKNEFATLNNKLQAARTELDRLYEQLRTAKAAGKREQSGDLQTKVTTTEQQVNALAPRVTAIQLRINVLVNNLVPDKGKQIERQNGKLKILQQQLQKDLDILVRSGAATPACVKSAAKQGSTAGASTTPASGDTIDKSVTGQQGGGPPASGAGLPADD
jgi:septal ring factor EnvC (AmiA/AmiB activator)